MTTVQTEHATTNTIQNRDGSTTVTTTTVTNTYTFNQAGNMTSAQQQTQVERVTLGTYVASWRATTTSANLSYRDAARQFGAGNLLAFQNSFLDTRGTLARYPGVQLQDIKDHPGRYIVHGVGLTAGFAIGGPAEGLITAVHALHTAYDLEKEVH